MLLKNIRGDVQDQLQTPEECALFIRAAIDAAGDDVQFLATALRDVARSSGMQQLERAATAGRRYTAAGTADRLDNARGIAALALSEIDAAGGPKTDAGALYVAGAWALLAELAAAAAADPTAPNGMRLQ